MTKSLPQYPLALHISVRMAACLLAALALAIQGAPLASASAIRSNEWPLDGQHFNADRLWQITKGSGITVAVIDSGVDATHPDLTGQVLPGTGELGDPTDNGQIDTSADSHGTAIAGIIAGTGKSLDGQGMTGLAPEAKILPVRVSAGQQVDPGNLAQGIIWAVDHGASVINVSIGSPRPDPVLRQAVLYAQRKDAVIVASAGNSGTDGDPPMYPASFNGVLSVAGTDEDGKPWKESEFGPGISLAAPATNIYSTNNQGQYVNADGTSYAAAYVSAAAALVRSQETSLTAGQVIRRLITTTADHHDYPDAHVGMGELDPLAALTSTAAPGSPDNPLINLSRVTPPAENHSSTITIAIVTLGVALMALAAVVGLRRKRAAVMKASRGNDAANSLAAKKSDRSSSSTRPVRRLAKAARGKSHSASGPR
ncbi:type VII secretion-associated serine protease mycosin [Kitasatospora sp. NBC_01266]|uniref:type VII secretion-associated serine protease mycosin n=1 Tax=Kitasatospora sp. NBC_01266 TaxID=2903572 RepID=UPI002E33ABCC|nr:type VII secretion-associated serine protease mycosin [Kitasatospora sp. NBC_01266]